VQLDVVGLVVVFVDVEAEDVLVVVVDVIFAVDVEAVVVFLVVIVDFEAVDVLLVVVGIIFIVDVVVVVL
jgi:hypothetical protein